MRELTDRARISRFMREAGRAATERGRIYLTGGACAVLLDWRPATIDIDVKIVPEQDALLRAFPRIKDSLQINVELASPGDFIPELPGWEARSTFIARDGLIDFFHYDFYSQCLSKIERGHVQDLQDASAMLESRLVDPDRLRGFFDEIEDEIYRYPALNASAFRRKVEEFLERER